MQLCLPSLFKGFRNGRRGKKLKFSQLIMDNIETDEQDGKEIVQRDNIEVKNSEEKGAPENSADKNRPVDHLLHAIGVIFGNSVSGNNVKLQENPIFIARRNEFFAKKSRECKQCRTRFPSRAALKLHSFSHTGPLRFKCDHEGCDWSFTTKYKLQRHKMVHLPVKRFPCKMEGCDKSFSEANGLRGHMQTHAIGVLECHHEGCNAKFSTIKQFENHLVVKHAAMPFMCKVESCSMGFETEHELNQHRAACHGKYICTFEGCEKSFLKKSVMKIHCRSHTNEKPFKCKYEGCNAVFTSSSKLNRHALTHSDERPYACEFDGCSARFKRHDHLRKHISQHSGKKPFVCKFEDCGATFTTQGSLTNHVELHKKENEFICPIKDCGKKYRCKATWRLHVKRHSARLDQKFEDPKPNVEGTDPDLNTALPIEPHQTDSNDGPAKDFTIQTDFNSQSSCDVALDINVHSAVAAIGDATSFHYINEVPNTEVVLTSQTATRQDPTSLEHGKMMDNSDGTSIVKKLLTRPGNHASADQKRNKLGKTETFLPDISDVEISISSQNLYDRHVSTSNGQTTLDLANSIFGGESLAVPLSMTRFLPQDMHMAEYLSNEYRNDHAYNRTLLSSDPRVLVSSDKRNLEPRIGNVFNVADLDGNLSVNASGSMEQVRSLLVENGMASFLANDDIGRMETCASQDDLGINRKFDLSVDQDLDVALMIDDCVIERQAEALNTGFSHYSSHDSYVSSLMESPHTVSEHLLNISNNPTMVDHMYSQHGPEEDELQIVTEDHAYEESTVNIQDIR